ncbi:hypothetical protein SynA1524_01057 [Synechococcus sp. A15-24]|nr:hypothetical protein SynA1524_01057 [Synechococcus sp. A15-24]
MLERHAPCQPFDAGVHPASAAEQKQPYLRRDQKVLELVQHLHAAINHCSDFVGS